mmetsp:Transcript_34442/g.68119  ORF Transcript_34442/g.68119 Transcript_34442/m.68119 type:complete len:112 (+) Transcript_34442:277-612(+)
MTNDKRPEADRSTACNDALCHCDIASGDDMIKAVHAEQDCYQKRLTFAFALPERQPDRRSSEDAAQPKRSSFIYHKTPNHVHAPPATSRARTERTLSKEPQHTRSDLTHRT